MTTDNLNSTGTSVFVPTYASFLALLKIDGKIIKMVLDKTIKGAKYPWGYPGGKEEEIDNRNILRTAVRESDEETGMAPGLELVEKFKIGTLLRRNDNPALPPFLNHFHACFLDGRYDPLIHNRKESIKEVGWFSLREAESMALKYDHRVAFIELCYLLDEMALTNGAIAYALMELQYAKFIRPSESNWKLEPKEESRKELEYYLPKSSIEATTRRR